MSSLEYAGQLESTGSRGREDELGDNNTRTKLEGADE